MTRSSELAAAGLNSRLGLDSEALAALGAACVDHGAAAASLHADQEAVGTGAADFGSLIRAFHDEDVGEIAPNATSAKFSGKPAIIANNRIRAQLGSPINSNCIHPKLHVDKVLKS